MKKQKAVKVRKPCELDLSSICCFVCQIMMNVQRRHITTAAVQEMNIVIIHKVALTVYATQASKETSLGNNVKVLFCNTIKLVGLDHAGIILFSLQN